MRRTKRWFVDLSIRGKLIIMFCAVCFAPLLFVSAYSYGQTRSQMLGQAKEAMVQTNRQVGANLHSRMEAYRQIMTLLYTDTMLKGYLTKVYERDVEFVEAYEYIDSLLYSLLAANGDVDSITIYVENKTIPTDAFFIKHLEDARNTPEWVREIDPRQPFATLQGSGINREGERVVSLGMVLNYSDMNFPYGILILDVKEAVIYSLIGEESDSKTIYITAEDGEIISTKEKGLIGSGLAQVLGYDLEQLQEGSSTMEVNGVSAVVAYDATPDGMQVISVVPSAQVLADAAATANRVLLIALASIALAVALIFRLSRYFSNRFALLGERIAKLQQAEFFVGEEAEPWLGNDEMGQLYLAFDQMARRLNTLINELYKKELHKKEAELQVLQSQINPHFLYNTLSAISSLALHNNDRETAQLVSHLSQFYKTSLNKGRRYISVKRELAITRHYIAIQHRRFQDRFVECWEVEEGVEEYATLKLLLQPFVENAITHGIVDDSVPVHITIRCFGKGEAIVYEVEDDGAGMPAETLEGLGKADGKGYGIGNVIDRIRLAYGQEYGVTIWGGPGRGTKVHIEIPRQTIGDFIARMDERAL